MGDRSSVNCKKPCRSCPWARTTVAGAIGGSDPLVFIGQAHAPFWLPCHNSPGYEEDRRNPNHRQCAGAAMYRDLAGVSSRLSNRLYKIDGDPSLVFATAEEFVAHHAQVPLDEAALVLSLLTPENLASVEMSRVAVQKM